MTVTKLLFTPGPLTTSRTVKEAMLRDLGSRDGEFLAIVGEIRERLLRLGGCSRPDYECVLMQGSGTFAIESVLSSTIPRDGKLLVLINGAYGRRIAQIARVLAIPVEIVEVPETRHVTAKDFSVHPGITHVAVVHCETTTGILNPIKEIGAAVSAAGASFFVDAMSSFGAMPINLADCSIDYLVSSANKCIEGVPGFGFILARREALLATEGYARSVSLDLLAQLKGLEKDGQFRFTPPTHVLLGFHQALLELDQEGGIEARASRYRENYRATIAGMRELGFEEYLRAEDQSYIITSFRYPSDPNFRFEEFYRRLNDKGSVIYPGKVSEGNCFRIGHIGRIFPSDVSNLLAAVRSTMNEMGIDLRERVETGVAGGKKK
jgi:2-aminoethylphosphonate-pyruvate transaminase